MSFNTFQFDSLVTEITEVTTEVAKAKNVGVDRKNKTGGQDSEKPAERTFHVVCQDTILFPEGGGQVIKTSASIKAFPIKFQN